MNLMLRACFGAIIFVLALCLLVWNEGNVVAKHRSIDEGKSHTISLGSKMINEIDPKRDGSLVHMTGDAVAVQSARDNELGVTPSQALRLARHVEIYQWIEGVGSPSENIEENTGVSSGFTYTQGWQTMLHQSDDFEVPEGHENPTEMLFTSEQFVATPIQLGAYTLSDNDAIVQKLSWFEDMVEGIRIDQIPDETIRNRMQMYGSNGLYYGDDPSSPQVGDLRITYQVVPSPETISIIAEQIGNTLATFQTSRSGYSILLLERGSVSTAEMYENAHMTDIGRAWMTRIIGSLVVYVALLIMAQPLKAVGDWIPLVNDLFGSATPCVLLPIAPMLELGVIAIVWIPYQPLLALIMLAIVVGYFRNRIQEARDAPTAEGYVVGNVDENEMNDDDVEMHTVFKD